MKLDGMSPVLEDLQVAFRDGLGDIVTQSHRVEVVVALHGEAWDLQGLQYRTLIQFHLVVNGLESDVEGRL